MLESWQIVKRQIQEIPGHEPVDQLFILAGPLVGHDNFLSQSTFVDFVLW